MNIIGRIKNELVIKCDGGFYHKQNTYGSSSGGFFCQHEKSSTWFDYLNIPDLPEITDEEIIKQLDDKNGWL